MALGILVLKNAQPRDKNWKLPDERGLYVLITPSGSKLWKFRYRHFGKEKKLSFGAFPEVSLKDARAKRDEARAMLANGRDPSRERKARRIAAQVASVNTLEAVAREFINKRVQDGIAEATKNKAEWLLSLLLPSLGRLPVAEISTPELLLVLSEVQETGRRETARRLRSFLGRVFNYAIATGRAQNNPAYPLRGMLITPSVQHHPAIVEREKLGSLLAAIESYGGYPSTIAALRLSAYLFQRPGEIRNMRWEDVDLDAARWKIPASRMKMRKSHEVPLSRQAMAIIRSMEPIACQSDFVLPAFHTLKKPLSENAVNGALRRLGYQRAMTAHGFRSTASSLLNESGRWSPDAIERALAHEDANAIRAIYNRSAYWQERVEMMQWWSDELDAIRAAAG